VRSSLELVECGMCCVCFVCVCVCYGEPPPFLYWVEIGGCGGNIPEHTAAPSSSPSMLSARARRAKEVPWDARAHLGWPPLGLSSRGRLSSTPGATWHGGLGLVLHEVGLLLHLAPLRLTESVFLTLFHCFQPLFLQL
jgi:hypothetical protein